MSKERKKILDMLAEGKIDASEAESLLVAIERSNEPPSNQAQTADKNDSSPKKLKYFRVIIESKNNEKEKVNIKIPLGLIRAGVKLASVIPGSAKDKINIALKEKGLNFNIDEVNSESIETILNALADSCIDIEDEKEAIKICCE